ncbi:MAG: hypothetical protein EOP04_18400 [Proteobacteria bacterium]|nr:MAG: hypothetical protein EOP04_18400 [Pseudomonadota bacterium]
MSSTANVYASKYSTKTGQLVSYEGERNGSGYTESYSIAYPIIQDGNIYLSWNGTYDCGERGPMTCDYGKYFALKGCR